jgi:L-alanine-DL-glutamate epimerase-like enolase superfamily enzyme
MTAARAACPIVRVETIPLAIPLDTVDQLDSTAETVLVVLTDAEGRQGVGEADAPPSVVKAFMEMPSGHLWSQGLAAHLVGADPVERTALWSRLYEATIYAGRRGLGIHVLSAIDLALHDLAGRQLGLPVWKLMGGARRARLRPYCTIYPGLPRGAGDVPRLMAETFRQFEAARAAGFRAMKMEVLYYDHVSDAGLAGLIREGRQALGPDITMMLDFGYRWQHWRDAARLLERIDDCDIYFAEATLQHDDLAGHKALAARAPMRICGAELAATRFEARQWIEEGGVDVIQTDISRTGGLTEILRTAELCALHGVELIPHGWKTGILAHAGLHFQAACPAAPFFELVSPHVYDSPLRRDLVAPEPVVEAGTVALPEAPGLGFELDWSAVDRYRSNR